MSKQLLADSMAQLNSLGDIISNQLEQAHTEPGTPINTARKGAMSLLKRLVTSKDSRALTDDGTSITPSSQHETGIPKGPWFEHFKTELMQRDESQRDRYIEILKKNPVVELEDSDSNLDLTALQMAMAKLEERYKRNRVRYLIAVALFIVTLVLLAIVVIVVLLQTDAPDPCLNFTTKIITNEAELHKVNAKGCNHFAEVTFSNFNGVGTLTIAKSIVNLTIECSGLLAPTSFSFPNLSNASLNIIMDNNRCHDSDMHFITDIDFPILAYTEYIRIAGLRSLQNLTFPVLLSATTIVIADCSFTGLTFPSATKFVTFEVANSIIVGEISVPLLENVSVLYITDINSEIATDVINPKVFTPEEYDVLFLELQDFERNGGINQITFPRNITLNLRSLTTALSMNFQRLYFFSHIIMDNLETVTDGVLCGMVVSSKIEFPRLTTVRNLQICDSYVASAAYEFMAMERIDSLEINNNIQHIILRFPEMTILNNIKVQQNGNFTLEGLELLESINSIVLEDTAGIANLTLLMSTINSIVIDRCDIVSIDLPNWTEGSIGMFSNNNLLSVQMPLLQSSSAVVFFLNPRLQELNFPALTEMEAGIQSSGVFWAIFVYGDVVLDLYSSYFLVGDSLSLVSVSAPNLSVIAQNHRINDNMALTNISFPSLENGNGSVVVTGNTVLQNLDFGNLLSGNVTVMDNVQLCLPSTFPYTEYPLSDNSTCFVGGNVEACDSAVTRCELVL
ncbi:hypothetical protein SARC_00664 [Sphaeroforma arctica JP610]|uniref:Receptor L-domain domain-containing protein n=1 Tax=Sphaeroforma arctica JP610 TaxID=667725 RepID=A0A0L0GEA0_9EUKA|nr:hypothetical protein SARC_00664 [Sphaeroforma arctica JP610]KNC87229.1 hypothetical protein SARC_00664 [Sphaeroforma arctica JP610]|eukprot:XP_014161131.1 hypothetical protein SARC_00664 [Sphaeroforma arctica JP610]